MGRDVVGRLLWILLGLDCLGRVFGLFERSFGAIMLVRRFSLQKTAPIEYCSSAYTL